MRLDYHGIGDSSGRMEQVDSLAVWRNNICGAIDHLKSISNAETVMLLGQRFGASLASEVAQQRTDVNSVVLWEPVFDGENYLNRLRAMHARMLDLWVCKMSTQDDQKAEEILGSMYSRELLDEIEQLRLAVGQIPQPQLIVHCNDSDHPRLNHSEPSLQKIIVDDRKSSWDDLRELESAYLRPQVSRRIVKLIREMFDRLERYDALTTATMEVEP
jgi:alpha/beta superfamily hydrolase